jgi:hypothetical protein
MLALFYNFVRSVELVHFNPIRQRDGVASDVSLEIVAAAARVDPLLPERGFNPAKSRTACQRAALFSPVRQSRSDGGTFPICTSVVVRPSGFVHSTRFSPLSSVSLERP